MEIARPKSTDQEQKKNIVPAPNETTTDQRQTEEKRISSHQEEERDNDMKPGQTTKEEKLKKKRGHHSVKKCPLQTCRYEGPNLLRYLCTKHKMAEDKVVKLNLIAGLEGKKRGTRRKRKHGLRLGLKVKWCPFQGCNFATHILSKHLQRVYKLKMEVLENYLCNAREYKGKLEQEEVQHYRNEKRKRSVLIRRPGFRASRKDSKARRRNS